MWKPDLEVARAVGPFLARVGREGTHNRRCRPTVPPVVAFPPRHGCRPRPSRPHIEYRLRTGGPVRRRPPGRHSHIPPRPHQARPGSPHSQQIPQGPRRSPATKTLFAPSCLNRSGRVRGLPGVRWRSRRAATQRRPPLTHVRPPTRLASAGRAHTRSAPATQPAPHVHDTCAGAPSHLLIDARVSDDQTRSCCLYSSGTSSRKPALYAVRPVIPRKASSFWCASSTDASPEAAAASARAATAPGSTAQHSTSATSKVPSLSEAAGGDVSVAGGAGPVAAAADIGGLVKATVARLWPVERSSERKSACAR